MLSQIAVKFWSLKGHTPAQKTWELQPDCSSLKRIQPPLIHKCLPPSTVLLDFGTLPFSSTESPNYSNVYLARQTTLFNSWLQLATVDLGALSDYRKGFSLSPVFEHALESRPRRPAFLLSTFLLGQPGCLGFRSLWQSRWHIQDVWLVLA